MLVQVISYDPDYFDGDNLVISETSILSKTNAAIKAGGVIASPVASLQGSNLRATPEGRVGFQSLNCVAESYSAGILLCGVFLDTTYKISIKPEVRDAAVIPTIRATQRFVLSYQIDPSTNINSMSNVPTSMFIERNRAPIN